MGVRVPPGVLLKACDYRVFTLSRVERTVLPLRSDHILTTFVGAAFLSLEEVGDPDGRVTALFLGDMRVDVKRDLDGRMTEALADDFGMDPGS